MGESDCPAEATSKVYEYLIPFRCKCGWFTLDGDTEQMVKTHLKSCRKAEGLYTMQMAKLEVPLDYDQKPSNPKDIIGSTKLPLSLVPGTTKAYLALGHLEGNLKYGLFNWRAAGVRTSIYLDALERHLEKFKNGEWADEKTKVPHLANAITCLSIIIDAHECGMLTDDRPRSAPVAQLIDKCSDIVKHLQELFKDCKPKHWTIDTNNE